MNDRISLKIPYKKEYVSIVRLTATVIANQLDFDYESVEDIKLAIGEACNNAILHSKKQNKNKENFTIDFTVIQNQLCIEIIDNGIGFNMSSYEKPNLKEYDESGLGIFIMQSLMDKVEINTKPDVGTTIKLIKYIN